MPTPKGIPVAMQCLRINVPIIALPKPLDSTPTGTGKETKISPFKCGIPDAEFQLRSLAEVVEAPELTKAIALRQALNTSIGRGLYNAARD